MKKIVLFVSVLFVFISFSTPLLAASKMPKGYIYTNRRYDFVKLERLSGRDFKGITATHPYQFTEDQMKGILASLKLDRKFIFEKKAKTRNVFDDKAVSFLAPYLIKAFEEAKPDQRIVVSYVSKDPHFIIRNDRLTIASMWMQTDGLHIRFHKLFAKMLGDTDKIGYKAKKYNISVGTRINIEPTEGQQLVSANELLVDTTFNFALLRPLKTEEETAPRVAVTTKDKKGAAEAESERLKYDREKSIKERMSQLDALYKDKLITKEDYEQKKKELLDQL